MATKVNQTVFTHVVGLGEPFTVTIPAVTAGNTLVMTFGGSAIPNNVRLTDGSGTSFTRRIVYSTGTFDSTVLDVTPAGGETVVFVDMNGDGCVSGVIYEMSGLGAFVGASGSSTVSDGVTTNTDRLSSVPAPVTVTGKSVLFATFLVQANLDVAPVRPYGPTFRLRQFGPLGRIHAEGGNQPPGNTDSSHLWMSAIADVDETHSYPVDLPAGQYQASSAYITGGNMYLSQAVYANGNTTNVNAAYPNPIVAENTLPGTHNSNWFLGNAGTSSTICGFADKLSYAPGETVNFNVHSSGFAFQAEIYRLGYYGWDTHGARRVAPFLTGTPSSQSAPVTDPDTGAVSCSWTPNASWAIPLDATPGLYYVIFRRTDVGGEFYSAHFTVKGSATGKANMVTPDFTHVAYNIWGAPGDNGALPGTWSGRSLYRGADGASPNFANRAYATSFDRPWSDQTTQQNTYIFDSQMGLIVFLEAQGYDLNYLSDIDLENNPTILSDSSLVILAGHSEYWTTNLYDAYTNARDAGVNMLIDSGNTALWHTRFDAADTNKRTMICYKDSATADVTPGFTGTGYDPVSYTGTWRDARTNEGTVNNTDIRRENALTGLMFKVNGPAAQTMDVPYAYKGLPLWRNSADIQALAPGGVYTTPTTVMGDEIDFLDGSVTQPTNLVKLSSVSATFSGQGANPNGSVYSMPIGTIELNFIMYRHGSGALVFNTGAWRGLENISRWYRQSYTDARTPDADWQNMVNAIMYDLGMRPQTVRPVKADDVALTDPAVGAPTGDRNAIAAAYGLQSTIKNTAIGFLGFL